MTEIVAITLSVAAVLFEKWRVTSPMAVANAMGEFREERGGAVLVAAPAPDETTAPVLDPGRGRTKTGQLWAYAADDRPWGGSDPPGVACVYAPDGKAERPIAHLDGFKRIRLPQACRARRCPACVLLVACTA